MVQLYGRDGGELTVNTQTPGIQEGVHVARLLSGGFVVIWTDGNPMYPRPWTRDLQVKGQIYDAAGAKVGAEFTVGTAGGNKMSAQAVAALPDGGFVATFGGDGYIFAQIFGADGAPLGEAIEVANFYLGSGFGSAVDVLASGDFVIAWARAGGLTEFDIYAQRFEADGSPVGGSFLVNTLTSGQQTSPSVTGLESGGFVVTWGEGSADAGYDVMRGQIYGSDGMRVGEFQLAATTEGVVFGAQIAALAGGGFVATWTDAIYYPDGSSSELNVKAQMFDEAGVRIGPEILVNTVTEGIQYANDIQVLPWGGFLVTWESSDGSGPGIWAQIFDSAGGKIGAAFPVNAVTMGSQVGSEFAVLNSGSLAFAFAGYGDNWDIKAQLFLPLPDSGDNVIAGGDGPNILDGGEGDDNITALGGNDILDGEGGNDVVRAGAGDDRLFVSGNGADFAEGGTGLDTLIVDYRDSTLRISSTVPTANPNGGSNGTIGGGGRRTDYNGIEALVVSTGSGDDSLIGLGGGDVLDGGAGNDVVNGEAGDDRLAVAGNGADIAVGGAGFDTLVVDYRDATLRISMTAPNANPNGGFNGTIGGGGRRTDYNGIEALVATTGSGDDLLIGFGGGDVLDGGAGSDVVNGGAGDDRLVVAGLGADIAVGGSGFDTLVVDYGDSAIRISMTAPTANPAGGANGTIGGGGRRTDYNSIEAFFVTTGSGSDSIVTGAGNDRIRPGSGVDVVSAGGGDDILLFLASLSAADSANGGSGVDTLVLQGHYAAGTTLANVLDVEAILLLSGGNADYGEPGTNRFDYVLTTYDSNFAAGVQAWINGIDLLPGEDLTFNGAAETDASFLIYGGKGVDTLTGGLGDDIFLFANQSFAQGDKVNGGGGRDTLILRGNHLVNFSLPENAGRLTGIESILLVSGSDAGYALGPDGLFGYEITLADADLAAGATLTIDGSTLAAGEDVYLDGSRESDGILNLLGGAGRDILTGGAGADVLQGGPGHDVLRGGDGADVFRYLSAADAPASSSDSIPDFQPGTDRIDLAGVDANSLAAGDQAFTWIGTAAFSGAGAASAGELRVVDGGYSKTVQGDIDGDGIADFAIFLQTPVPTPLEAGDFIL